MSSIIGAHFLLRGWDLQKSKNNCNFATLSGKFPSRNAVIAQLVEHQLPKLRVASSSLVYRSKETRIYRSPERQILVFIWVRSIRRGSGGRGRMLRE